jgi:hypothetical protein
VAHAYNPSYSAGRDQEDYGSKPAWANSSVRLYLEKPFTKIGLMEWLKVKAPGSSPSTTHTQKKKNPNQIKPKKGSRKPAPRWLMAIILATQEAEVRRVAV